MASIGASGEPNPASSDTGLRRSYTLRDMKLHACSTTTDDATVVGASCPPSLVVFGPYVTAPAHSDVILRFEIKANSDLTLMSDVVSSSADLFHGALDEQILEPNEKRVISYRLHVFEQAPSLETRIGIKSATPASFEISNFDLRIE